MRKSISLPEIEDGSTSTTACSIYMVRDLKYLATELVRAVTKSTLISTGLSTLAVVCVLCLLLLWDTSLFFFFVQVLCISMQLMVFTVFCFSNYNFSSSFFMIIGFGYGFAGFFSVIQYATGERMLSDDVVFSFNANLQLWLIGKFIEAPSIMLALAFARKTFKGWKVVTIVFFVYCIVSMFLLLSVFQWKTFPECFAYDSSRSQLVAVVESSETGRTGRPTPFFQVFAWLSTAVFIGGDILLVYRRKEFHSNVFVFLFIGFAFRVLSTALGAIVYEVNDRVLLYFSFLSRLLSFAYIFVTMVLSTLKNPMDTLFHRIFVHQTALENQKKFAEWMIDQLPVIIVILDKNGYIKHMNQAAQQAYGKKIEDVLNFPFFSTLLGESEGAKHSGAFMNAVNKGEAGSLKFSCAHPHDDSKLYEWTCNIMQTDYANVVFQNETPRATKSTRTVDNIEFGRLAPDPISEHTVVLCLAQDITAQQKREELLVQARNQAEKLSKLKDAFVANVSHELRTPLNCIIGMSSLLLHSPLSLQQIEMVNMLGNASNSLLHLINDILDFSMIQHEGKLKLDYSWFNLRNLIEDTVMAMSLIFQDNSLGFGYRIHKECPETICCDEKRLRQILTNLLNNAIKFTQKGQVIVTVSMKKNSNETLEDTPTTKNMLLFQVIDSGIGIKKEDLPKLFKRFTQIEYTYTRKFGGTGLGLAISRTIAEMLGGIMDATSEFGKGSTFWFSIPTVPTDVSNLKITMAQPQKSLAPVSQVPSHVLILLPNQVISSLLTETLRYDFNLKVTPTATLDELFDALGTLKKTLSTTDEAQLKPFVSVIVEPNGDGTDTLRKLKSLQNSSFDIHIVHVNQTLGITQKSQFEVDFISKPIKLSALYLCLCRSYSPLSSSPSFDRDIRPLPPADEPKLQQAHPAPTSTPTPTPSAKVDTGPKVLIVEDNPVNVKVISMFLRKLKVAFEVANNGQEAVNLYNDGKFDLILMDIQMPVMDGYTATKEIRSLEAQSASSVHIPIIALTANAMENDRAKCFEVGMDDYMAKPVKLEVFREKLVECNILPTPQ